MFDPFVPGETDHPDRVLTALRFYLRRGRLTEACDLLEVAEELPLTADQLVQLEHLAGEIVARGEAILRVHGRPAPPAATAGRVLRFRSRRSAAPPRTTASIAARRWLSST